MTYKPMPPKLFLSYLKLVGWRLEKGSVDWKAYDEKSVFVCTIQISHGSKTKQEVTALSVRKIEKEFKERGLRWPPSKKLKKN